MSISPIINLQKYLFFDKLIDVPELVSKIILSWQEFGIVDLRTKEGQSFAECGLYDLLDSVCATAGIEKSSIKLMNNNWTENHNEYEIQKAPFSYEILHFNKSNPGPFDYVGDKFYGIFIGRANTPRIKAIIQSHKRFIPAVRSFNDGMESESNRAILNSLIVDNECLKSEALIATKKHSDIGSTLNPPIVPPLNSVGSHWQLAYSKIVLEIVLETTDWPGSFHITEKVCRPIYYKRPFILIGAKGFMSRLRDLGFKTFEDIIPNYYENFDYCVEQAFRCLDDIYAKNAYGFNGQQRLLDDCKEDIEHNYELLIKLSNQHLKSFNELGGLSYFGPQ